MTKRERVRRTVNHGIGAGADAINYLCRAATIALRSRAELLEIKADLSWARDAAQLMLMSIDQCEKLLNDRA